MFNVNRGNNQFSYDSSVFSINNTLTSYSSIIPGEHDLTETAELIKDEINGNVIIETEKNTMKFIMQIKQGALSLVL